MYFLTAIGQILFCPWDKKNGSTLKAVHFFLSPFFHSFSFVSPAPPLPPPFAFPSFLFLLPSFVPFIFFFLLLLDFTSDEFDEVKRRMSRKRRNRERGRRKSIAVVNVPSFLRLLILPL